MVLSATIVLAQTWNPDPLVNDPQWDVLNGQFGGSFSGDGVYSVSTDYSTAACPLPVGDGNFELSIPFTLNGDGTRALVGISTASSAQDTSGWTVIGNNPDGALGYSHGGLGNINYFSDQQPTMGTKYTAKIVSTDGGNTATLSVDGYPGSETVDLGGDPTYVVLYLNNNGILGSAGDVPLVSQIDYTYTEANTSPTPTPTTTPTATPQPTGTPSKVSLDLQGIREFYAHQPVVHMSNQSVIYNPDGTIKQVVTGPANATGAVITATPQPTVKPNVTTNATVTPVPANVTATPAKPSPTKAQSPGFEIVLAAMGMIAALALITRKKK